METISHRASGKEKPSWPHRAALIALLALVPATAQAESQDSQDNPAQCSRPQPEGAFFCPDPETGEATALREKTSILYRNQFRKEMGMPDNLEADSKVDNFWRDRNTFVVINDFRWKRWEKEKDLGYFELMDPYYLMESFVPIKEVTEMKKKQSYFDGWDGWHSEKAKALLGEKGVTFIDSKEGLFRATVFHVSDEIRPKLMAMARGVFGQAVVDPVSKFPGAAPKTDNEGKKDSNSNEVKSGDDLLELLK